LEGKLSKSKLEDLDVYNNSIELSDIIWNLLIQWDNFSRDTIGIQIVKAIDSAGANISEGYGKESKIDNARFVKIARGSLFETRYWLNISNRRKLISDSEQSDIDNKIVNLLPRLIAYINYLLNSSVKK
jgi:four helix bundle protein